MCNFDKDYIKAEDISEFFIYNKGDDDEWDEYLSSPTLKHLSYYGLWLANKLGLDYVEADRSAGYFTEFCMGTKDIEIKIIVYDSAFPKIFLEEKINNV